LAQVERALEDLLVVLQINLGDGDVERPKLAVRIEIALVGFLDRAGIVRRLPSPRGSGARETVLVDDGPLTIASTPGLLEADLGYIATMFYRKVRQALDEVVLPHIVYQREDLFGHFEARLVLLNGQAEIFELRLRLLHEQGAKAGETFLGAGRGRAQQEAAEGTQCRRNEVPGQCQHSLTPGRGDGRNSIRTRPGVTMAGRRRKEGLRISFVVSDRMWHLSTVKSPTSEAMKRTSPAYRTIIVLASAALLLGAAAPIISVPHSTQQRDLDQALLDAVIAGDASRVEVLIGQGADAGAANQYDVTALSFAADRGHVDVVRVLLEAGAEPDVTDTFYGMNPITRAMSQEYPDIVRLLLEHGADGGPVLMDAMFRDDVAAARQALAPGNVDARTLSSALRVAVARGNGEFEAILREAGAVEELPAAETVPISADALRRMVGTYDNPQTGPRAVVQLDGEDLVVTIDGESHALRHVGERAFEAVDDPGLALTFAGRGGAVERIQYRRGETGAMLTPVDLELEAAAEAEGAVAVAEGASALADAAVVAGLDAAPRGAPINWPAFRGANAAGNGDGQGIPSEWSIETGDNIRWRTPVPGIANSSPVIWGERIFVTTAISGAGDDTVRTGLYGDTTPVDDLSSHSFRVYALDKQSGDIVWERELYEGPPLTKRHTKSSQANSTPAVDDGHVVVVFGAIGRVICLDHDGNVIWENVLDGALDSGWFFDPSYQWGHGSSPIIYEGTVILQADQQRGSFVAAYDLETGDEIWRSERDEIPSWGTPTIYRGEPRDELITNGKTIRSYDPHTGELLWWLTPNSELPVATPVVGDGLIYLSNRYPPIQRIYAVHPGGSGDISLADGETSNEWIEWSKTRSVSYLPSPILYDDLFYTQGDDGRLITYGAHTGEVVYQARIGGTGGAYVASPVIADGRIFFTSEECTVHVAAAGPEYRDIVSNDMDDVCWATPAISDGLLVIRTLRFVYGIGS